MQIAQAQALVAHLITGVFKTTSASLKYRNIFNIMIQSRDLDYAGMMHKPLTNSRIKLRYQPFKYYPCPEFNFRSKGFSSSFASTDIIQG